MTGEPALPRSRAILIIVLVIIIIAVAAALNSGNPPSGQGAGTGTLTGNVSVGPLCPVEPCTVSRDRLIEAYAARPVTVSTPSGAAVAAVTADPETGYTIALRPGTTLSISRTGE
jgi:hypothetical protein